MFVSKKIMKTLDSMRTEAFFGKGSIEDIEEFECDGEKYCLDLVEELETIGNGKYQSGGAIYSIRKKCIEEVLFYVKQSFTRTGSYYTTWDYIYEDPYVVKKCKKMIEITEWEGVE